MAYWLIKSEPSAYSWDQLVKDKKTSWTGVRNFQAQINLKAMKHWKLLMKMAGSK
ncbi:MAG: EVE domain-containing protein [Rhodospirillales bacterium]|nr:EVE domain-containing protein [Rhodospirillales bacterium]